jgi:DNA (cytosine-5)-methyltransferase 1
MAFRWEHLQSDGRCSRSVHGIGFRAALRPLCISMLKVLSLFAGIGGFDLGLERAGGFKTVAFCEIDPFCRRVLAKHWPEVPCYHDVRELTAARIAADGIGVDVICGGFPCQDISEAGKGAGLAGERSGLWSEIARLAGELRPQFLVVENVAALLARGLGTVLGDLAALGYDAEWHCIPAAAVGAPHRRDRIWIIAYLNADGRRFQEHGERDCGKARGLGAPQRGHVDGFRENVADAERGWGRQSPGQADEARQPLCAPIGKEGAPVAGSSGEAVAFPNGSRHEGPGCELPRGRPVLTGSALQDFQQWEVEPDVGRVADGVSDWSHRIRALGNAVVPQIPEIIGRAILSAIADRHSESGDVKQAPSRSDESGGAGTAIAKKAA